MATYTFGTRTHDLGKGTPQEMFEKLREAGFGCTQLAYKKAIAGVTSYADVTDTLVQDTVDAIKTTGVFVSVLGTYVELSMADEAQRKAASADFCSQLAVCKALNAGCIGSETTKMEKQPAGTTRKEAQECLLKTLGEIMPKAEELGVLVGIEPVFYHAMNTPEAAKMVLDTIASPNLRVIFDAANLIDAEHQAPAAQADLWHRAMNLWGEKIVACHVKGVKFDNAGDFHSASFADSCLDYKQLAGFIRQLPQDLPIMREEQVPAQAAQDLALLRVWFCG